MQLQRRRTNAQRRKARVTQVIDRAAELAQRIHQIANRALVHAGHTAELKVAAQHGQRGSQRAHRGTGIAHEELGRWCPQLAAHALDDHCVAILLHIAAQLTQRDQHHAGVIRVQQVVDGGAALGHGG